MRLLLIEDDTAIADRLAARLEAEGYILDRAGDGEVGRYMGETADYAAIILDIGLPEVNGLDVLSDWRDAGVKTPVLLLTARSSWRDKVVGLRSGADDYLAKPFETEELLARLEALIRRAGGHSDQRLTLGDLEIDLGRRAVAVSGMPVALSPNEYRALAYLAVNRGKVVTKIQLGEQMYMEEIDRDLNAIEATVARLRKKIGPERIKTRRGHGYLVE